MKIDFIAHACTPLLLLSSPTDADIVCLQEVSPVSFEDDFAFMAELGYDGKEMYKKGRFRPATFWKTSQCELAAPPVHKDRTLLTSFRLLHKSDSESKQARNWYVLNCHLQAGKQAKRRLRQINEGVRAVVTLARKLKGAYRIVLPYTHSKSIEFASDMVLS
jgi:hypothetical protein